MSQRDCRDSRCMCALSFERVLCLHFETLSGGNLLISGSLFLLLWCEGNSSWWQEPVKGLFWSAFILKIQKMPFKNC